MSLHGALSAVASWWRHKESLETHDPEIVYGIWLRYLVQYNKKKRIADQLQFRFIPHRGIQHAFFDGSAVDIGNQLLTFVPQELVTLETLEQETTVLQDLIAEHVRSYDYLQKHPDSEKVELRESAAMHTVEIIYQTEEDLKQSKNKLTVAYAYLTHLHDVLNAQVALIALIRKTRADAGELLFKLQRLILVDEYAIVTNIQDAHAFEKRFGDTKGKEAVAAIRDVLTLRNHEKLQREVYPSVTPKQRERAELLSLSEDKLHKRQAAAELKVIKATESFQDRVEREMNTPYSKYYGIAHDIRKYAWFHTTHAYDDTEKPFEEEDVLARTPAITKIILELYHPELPQKEVEAICTAYKNWDDTP